YLKPSFADFEGIAADVANSDRDPRLVAIGAVVIGIVLAAAIQALTGYFTETNRRPVQDIGKTSVTGPATVVLAGVSVGLESAVRSEEHTSELQSRENLVCRLRPENRK